MSNTLEIWSLQFLKEIAVQSLDSNYMQSTIAIVSHHTVKLERELQYSFQLYYMVIRSEGNHSIVPH